MMEEKVELKESLRRQFQGTVVTVALILVTVLAVASPASAAPPEFLLQVPEGSTAPGAGAGQFKNPAGLATNTETGHFYAVDIKNMRVNEFTAWGVFVRAWGWDVAPDGAPGDTSTDEFEICTLLCQEGKGGGGAGQLASPTEKGTDLEGLAIDADGNVYLFERENHRVQKFDSEGHFLLMFGGRVNQSKVSEAAPDTEQNLCPVAPSDVCQAGTPGTGKGQFDDEGQLDGEPRAESELGNYIAYDVSTDGIVVGDRERISIFEPTGTLREEIDDVQAPVLAGELVQALAVSPSGEILLVFVGKDDVYRLNPVTGQTILPNLPVPQPVSGNSSVISLATDAAGTVYAVYDPEIAGEGREPRILAFNSAGQPVVSSSENFAAPPAQASSRLHISGLAAGSACGSGLNVFVAYTASSASHLAVFGTPPIACEEPPVQPPDIRAQYATSVDSDSAVLKADINPRFWNDTTYYLEYGPTECSKGGCFERPSAPGSLLTEKVTSSPITTAGVLLGDLEPGTTYHYRFVAQSGGSEGERVFGVGAGPGEDGTEGTFTTFSLGQASEFCPANHQHRSGLAAHLPDCRAYEMVSPLDKSNGDIVTAINITGFPTSLMQSSTLGERLTYSSATSFGGADGTPYASQYLAVRDPDGWRSEPLSPRRTKPVLDSAALTENEFKGFSADLCNAWMRHDSDPPLAEGAVPGYVDLYRRDNCAPASGAFEALTQVEPAHLEPIDYSSLEIQGFSADGTHSIFVANDNLPGTGAPNNTNRRLQLYEYSGGKTRYVCILPSGLKSQACAAGLTDNPSNSNVFRKSNWDRAISGDGSRIFWTHSTDGSGPGKIYVRDSQGTTSVADDTTTAVSEAAEVLSGSTTSHYWSAAADGSKAIFTTEKEHLYEFEVDQGSTTLIAGKVSGVMGVSEDASRIYFASGEVLDGAEENSNGAVAIGGRPNLYLYQQGVGSSFIATLDSRDVAQTGVLSPIHPDPSRRASRVSPDGRHAAFVSTESLIGYDNNDAIDGAADTEVFLYDADTKELLCPSCNPNGARPLGQGGIAAKIPGWERSLYPSRALSADGSRLYFESHESLVLRDTNGVQDVYQWEEAGVGSCEESSSTFAESSGGCIDLISSGESSRSSSFVDADLSGEDVFFSTLSGLVPQDYGLVDIYNARVDGGFAGPPSDPLACEGEACQAPPAPPNDPTPASAAFNGMGNVSEGGSRRCTKHKVQRKGRCVAKKSKREKRGHRQTRHRNPRAVR